MSSSTSAGSGGRANRSMVILGIAALAVALAVWFWRAPDPAQAGAVASGDPTSNANQEPDRATKVVPIQKAEQIEAAAGKDDAPDRIVLPPQDLPQLPLVDVNVERTKDMEVLKAVLPKAAPSFIACVGRHALTPGAIEPGLRALIQVGPGEGGRSVVTGLSFAGGKEPPVELATCLRGALTTVSFDLPAGTRTIIETPPLLGEKAAPTAVVDPAKNP